MNNAVLTITIENGKLSLNGPIENKLIAYGMLELAKDAINEFHAAQARQVQPATLADLNLVGGGH